jgi:hypothetical protein
MINGPLSYTPISTTLTDAILLKSDLRSAAARSR